MKTAMQELLDITYKSIFNAKELKLNGLNDQREIDILLNVYNVYRVIIERDMLEKEKDRMFHSFYAGVGYDEVLDDCDKIFEQYYNEVFNQNK
jgi:hypothetical protein